MDDKKQIDVCIADCAPIPILVTKEEEPIVYKAQDNVTHLWKVWKSRYSKEKSPIEIMAQASFPIKSSPIRKACARPSGLGCSA